MSKKYLTRVYLNTTQEEKDYIRNQAKENNFTTTNEYLRYKLLPHQSPDIKSEYLEPGQMVEAGIDRHNMIKTTLSDNEYAYVKKAAGEMSLSTYLRKLLLSTNGGKYSFEISSGDISELTEELSAFNQRMEGIIGALRFREELYQTDIENMTNLLNELNENVKSSSKTIMADRKFIQKDGTKYLRAKIDASLRAKTTEGGSNDGNM